MFNDGVRACFRHCSELTHIRLNLLHAVVPSECITLEMSLQCFLVTAQNIDCTEKVYKLIEIIQLIKCCSRVECYSTIQTAGAPLSSAHRDDRGLASSSRSVTELPEERWLLRLSAERLLPRPPLPVLTSWGQISRERERPRSTRAGDTSMSLLIFL